MKIGILGGTFNPVHYGHIWVASRVLKMLKLDRVVFVPSAHPPHKEENKLPSALDRYTMVELAIKGNPHFYISDIELKRKGKSYTIDTVSAFKRLYPGAKIYFIIGRDTLPEISTWKNYRRLLKMCQFVVVNRPGYPNKKFVFKNSVSVKNLTNLRIRGINISSTEIRARIKEGKGIKGFVPQEVEEYIRKKGLYQ